VRIRRRGGFAGLAVSAELDTAALPADAAGRLERAVAGLPGGRPAAAPPHPDAFRYEVGLPDDPGRGTAVLGERDLDGDLAPLLDRLAEAGLPDPPGRAAGEPRRPAGRGGTGR
jgi:hypothetical protein